MKKTTLFLIVLYLFPSKNFAQEIQINEPPIITKMRKAYPGIHVEIIASNALTDLRLREADIAVRNMVSTQPDLIVKKPLHDEARFRRSGRVQIEMISEELPSRVILGNAKRLGRAIRV